MIRKESMTKTVLIKPDDAPSWDAFVRAQPGASYCHLHGWSSVIEEVYRHRPYYLAAVDTAPGGDKGDAIRGIFPLFRFKPLFSRPKLVSIPFFDQAGLLAEDRQTESLLFHAALRLMREKGCSGLEIRQNAPSRFADAQCPAGLDSSVSTLKVSLKIRLAESPEAMLRGFKAKLRSQIVKGRKNGLQAQVGKEELLDPFYQVFSRNMRDLGSPVHSRRFFEAIFKYFHDEAFICLVTFQSRPVAAGFLFRFKDEIKNPWASSLREYRHLNTNMLLYWEMVRFACEQGMQRFDMGRSSHGAPTYRFKKQWGPEEQRLYWYTWFPAGNNVHDHLESLTLKAWRRLPMFAANILGPLVRGNISL